MGQYYHLVNIANTNVTADETTSFKTNIYKEKKKLLLILKESFKHKWPFVMKVCRIFKYCKKWDKIYQCFRRLVFLWYDIISVSFLLSNLTIVFRINWQMHETLSISCFYQMQCTTPHAIQYICVRLPTKLYSIKHVYLAETKGSIYNPHVNDMFVICNIFCNKKCPLLGDKSILLVIKEKCLCLCFLSENDKSYL